MNKPNAASAAINQPLVATSDSSPANNEIVATHTTAPLTQQAPDVAEQINAAVAAENGRIMGILNCEEAQGREAQARALAETPGMTVETAQRILAAAPQSAQARSETALDRQMESAPGALSANTPSSDEADDLLNTPV